MEFKHLSLFLTYCEYGFLQVTYFPDDPAGDAKFDYFKQVVRVETLDMALAPFSGDLSNIGLALFTLLYVDFLDTSVSKFLSH